MKYVFHRFGLVIVVGTMLALLVTGRALAAEPETGGAYIALGDSVAAGLGLEEDADSNEARCGRSTFGYPNLVANDLNMTLKNVSCSGATVGDLVTKQRVEGPDIPLN